ncbi:MAG: MoaD/ThiS family protein [Planctomycetaceae bacterium]
MTITVKLFARASDLAGTDCVSLDLPAAARVGDLKAKLVARFPQLSLVLPNLLVAVDNDYASDAEVLPANAEVACFPPVSGG